MTDVNKNMIERIATPEAALALYKDSLTQTAPVSMGFEGEYIVYNDCGPHGFAMAAPQQTKDIANLLKAKGYDVNFEASSVIEYPSKPYVLTGSDDLSEVGHLLHDIEKATADYIAASQQIGLNYCPYGILPTATVGEAMAKLVDNPRVNTMAKMTMHHMPPDVLHLGLFESCAQVSFGFSDHEEMYDSLRRGLLMAPLFYSLSDNHAGFMFNNDKALSHSPRIKFYEGYKEKGGMPDSFFTTDNADDYVGSYVNFLFNENKMYFHYDKNGRIVYPENGNFVTFRDLIERDENTRTNFFLSETFAYHDMKLCRIRDNEGMPTGARLEVRSFDTGRFQQPALVLLSRALLCDKEAGKKLDGVLENFGFKGNPKNYQASLLKVRKDVAHHGGRYMDVSFGDKGYKLTDFSKEIALLTHDFYKGTPYESNMESILHVCNTGENDAKATSMRYKTLPEVMSFMREKGNELPYGKCLALALA